MKDQIEAIIATILENEHNEKERILSEGHDQIEDAETQIEKERIKFSLLKRAGTLRKGAGDCPPGEYNKKAAVANIAFAYANHEVIELLKARGTAITALNKEEMQKKDEELINLIRNEENFNTFKVPVCAFVTFENDDAYNIASENP